MDPLALASLDLPARPATRSSRAASYLSGAQEGGFGALFDTLLTSPATLMGQGATPATSAAAPGNDTTPWMTAQAKATERRQEAWVRLTGTPLPDSAADVESVAKELFRAGLIDTETYVELTASPFDTPQGDIWNETGNRSATQHYFDTTMQQLTQQAMMKLKT